MVDPTEKEVEAIVDQLLGIDPTSKPTQTNDTDLDDIINKIMK